MKELKDAFRVQGAINPPKIIYGIHQENWKEAKELFKELFKKFPMKKQDSCRQNPYQPIGKYTKISLNMYSFGMQTGKTSGDDACIIFKYFEHPKELITHRIETCILEANEYGFKKRNLRLIMDDSGFVYARRCHMRYSV